MKTDTKDCRFFWVREQGEIFAARDLEELNRYMRRLEGADDPDWYPALTRGNRGEQWDEVDGAGTMLGEDGKEMTYREAVETGPPVPCQVATTYN